MIFHILEVKKTMAYNYTKSQLKIVSNYATFFMATGRRQNDLHKKRCMQSLVVRDYIFTLVNFVSQLIQQIKSLSLSLITSIESISAPSSFVTIASFASNPNFSPVQEYTIHKYNRIRVLKTWKFSFSNIVHNNIDRTIFFW